MFSDLQYLQSALFLSFAFPVLLYRIAVTDGFKAFSWRSFKRVELKAITALLIFLSMLLMIIYNWIASVIKYREGFWVDQVTGLVITRPLEKYDVQDRALFPSISVLLNLSWTLQGSALTLMMALWNHMAKAVLNKQFMSSVEFKAYATYSLLSLAVYPFLQTWYYLSGNLVIAYLVPLFLMCFQCFVLIVLTGVTNFRFGRLLSQLGDSAVTSKRIKHYYVMNNLLALCLLLQMVGIFAIAVDAVTADILYYNKFLLDLLTTFYGIGFNCSLPIGLFILFPNDTVADEINEARRTIKLRASQFQPPVPTESRFFTNGNHAGSPNLSPVIPEERKPLQFAERDTRGYFKIKLPKIPSVRTETPKNRSAAYESVEIFSESHSSVAHEHEVLEHYSVEQPHQPQQTDEESVKEYADSSISFYLNKTDS